MKCRYLIILLAAIASLILSVCIGPPYKTTQTAEQIRETELNPGSYSHNWDENPVAYIPEVSTGNISPLADKAPSVAMMQQYIHNWDENPVAYIPEVTVVDVAVLSREIPSGETLRQYAHHWDENPVAYVPEATLINLRPEWWLPTQCRLARISPWNLMTCMTLLGR